MNKLNFKLYILLVSLKSILIEGVFIYSTHKSSSCQCKFLTNITQTRIECYNSELSSCTSLKFENCDVPVITNNIFETLPAVTYLAIKKCNLKSINKQNFGGGNNVKIIHLDENQLKILPSEVFAYTPNVEKIWLSTNQIEYIDERSFFNLTNLTAIGFYGNKIKYLPVGVFRTLRSLEWLSIAKNQIDFIPEELFDGNPNLETLYASENRLTIIDENIVKNRRSLNFFLQSGITEATNITSRRFFKNLTKLKLLSLWRNHIPYISEDMFSKLSDLEHLDAGAVNLSYIESGSFNSQTKMRRLAIHKNKLEKININSLRNMKKLEELRIYNNEIKELDYRILAELPLQTKVYMSKDKMNCTYFSQLVDFLKDRINLNISNVAVELNTCSTLNRTTEHTSEQPDSEVTTEMVTGGAANENSPKYIANVCIEPENFRNSERMFKQIQNKIDIGFKADTPGDRQNLIDLIHLMYSVANELGFNLI